MSEYLKFKTEGSKEIEAMANDANLTNASENWLAAATPHKYSYHFEYLGRPIIQYPQDMVAMQELIWQIKPDLIIETGIAHGGSLIMSAAMLAQIDLCEAIDEGKAYDPAKSKRRVLGIDIEIREHNRRAIEAHPMFKYIDMIEGSAIAPDVISQVHQYASGHERVLVCLDSMHTHDHVFEELEAYAKLVTVGSYCVVFDTIVEDLPEGSFPDRPWDLGNNPKTAVWKWIESNTNFEIDKTIDNKLQISVAPDGFLKRIS